MKYFVIYLCIINALAFLLMHIDKQKAKKNRWRIPEATLIGMCAIGGSVGGLLGMYLLRHKTKHIKFYLGIPVILALQLVALYYFRDYLF